MSDLSPPGRAPLLVLGFIALVLGVAGGLVRVGVPVPAAAAGISWHGALMASAFFGTLISLERAVAIARRWAYAAPAASGAGGIALLFGAVHSGLALMAFGAAALVVSSASIWLRDRTLHTGLLVLGAAALLAANLALALGVPMVSAVPSWVAFFVLTIGGERLELSRLTPVPRAARLAFGALGSALLACALVALVALDPMLRASGALLLACVAWLGAYDIATRTVRASGLTRYMALCLLAGYAWLAVGGALLAAGGFASGEILWDAALHAILVGFVFSMVFGHAPVILPAVLRVSLPYGPLLYLPLALLHASLALRVAGDAAAMPTLRSAGALGNAAAIALFIVCAAGLALRARRALERS